MKEQEEKKLRKRRDEFMQLAEQAERKGMFVRCISLMKEVIKIGNDLLRKG